MRQEVDIFNWLDGDLNPAGGSANGTGIRIYWQSGPLNVGGERKEPNGAFVEDVLEVCKKRLEFYNSTKFNCYENTEAIYHIELALAHLDRRTQRRIAAGTEGTHEGF